MHDATTKGYTPTEIPAGWQPPAHPYPDMRCERCGGQLIPWGTLLRDGSSLVVLHCGDHPVADRVWDERRDADCGRLHETRR